MSDVKNGRKDPNALWVWAVILGLVFVTVPYFFTDSSERLVWGLPLWFIVSLVSALLLAVVTALVIRFRWSLAKSILGEEE